MISVGKPFKMTTVQVISCKLLCIRFLACHCLIGIGLRVGRQWKVSRAENQKDNYSTVSPF